MENKLALEALMAGMELGRGNGIKEACRAIWLMYSGDSRLMPQELYAVVIALEAKADTLIDKVGRDDRLRKQAAEERETGKIRTLMRAED